MQKTSRMYILDLVEAIINQIQLASHCQELLHFYSAELQRTTDDVYWWMMDIQQDLLDKAVDMRRVMMEKLKTENSDEKMWCSLKHALSAYWFMLEVSYANKTDLAYKILAHQAYEQLMKVLSIFMWLDEIVTCGRCLCDQITEDANW